jgi:hypothetical protein
LQTSSDFIFFLTGVGATNGVKSLFMDSKNNNNHEYINFDQSFDVKNNCFFNQKISNKLLFNDNNISNYINNDNNISNYINNNNNNNIKDSQQIDETAVEIFLFAKNYASHVLNSENLYHGIVDETESYNNNNITNNNNQIKNKKNVHVQSFHNNFNNNINNNNNNNSNFNNNNNNNRNNSINNFNNVDFNSNNRSSLLHSDLQAELFHTQLRNCFLDLNTISKFF